MQARGITFEQVALEAEKFAWRGEKPTARAIRGELGTGSLVTVQKHLVAWREGRRPAEPMNPNLPPELGRVFLAELERQVSATRAVLEAELTEMRADRDSITEEAERQSIALTAAEQRIAELVGDVERQAGAFSQLERALAEAHDQASREREVAEQARRASAVAELQLASLPGLNTQIEALTAKLDAEREARRVAEIEAAELRGPSGGKKS